LAKDGTLAVRCHSCGASGDALTLVAYVHGRDLHREFHEVLRIAAEIANAPSMLDALEGQKRHEPEPDTLSDETYHTIWSYVLDACTPTRAVAPGVVAYLKWRGGLDVEAQAAGVRGLPNDARRLVRSLLATFERRNLELAGVLRPSHDAIDWAEWSLLIPWRDRFGRIRCVQRRRIEEGSPKYRSPRGRSPCAPFGVDLIASSLRDSGTAAEVIFTEGALDCLARRAIARARNESCEVLGVYSATSPDRGLPLDLLRGRRVVLALDDDDAGDRACVRLADLLQDVAAEMVRERPPVGSKDWANVLTKGAA
jgi:DNA primase